MLSRSKTWTKMTLSFSTYAYSPPRRSNGGHTSQPPALLPILPPPTNARPPRSLRSRPTTASSTGTPPPTPSPNLPGWTLSKHTCPAAYPRTLPHTTSPSFPARSDPYGPPSGLTKDARKSAISAISRTAIECAIEAGQGRRTADDLHQMRADVKPGDVVHYQSIDRYTLNPFPSESDTSSRTTPPQGQAHPNEPIEEEKVTLVCLHANGFHKEMFLPTLQRLFELWPSSSSSAGSDGAGGSRAQMKSEVRDEKLDKTPHDLPQDKTTVKVDEILLIDIYNHGESYLLNDGKIGRAFDWQDVARDMITLLQHCLPPPADEVDPKDVPELLPYHPQTQSSSKRKRKIVGIGHSIGGNALVQASHARPDLFHQLILIDPMTRPLESLGSGLAGSPASALVKTCIGRRDTWPTLQSAEEDLLRSPYFRRWDQGVFSSFLQHGLGRVSKFPTYQRVQGEDEETVGLMTPRWAEAAVFAGGREIAVGYDKLARLRRDLKVSFIMAEDASSTGGPERTHDIVWRPPRAENVIVKGAGHLVMQEKPLEVAKAIHASLNGWSIECDEKVFADKARL